MRDDKRPLPEFLWYVGGFLPLAGVCLIWTSMGDQPVTPQRIMLFILGAAIGGFSLLAAGELIRPINAQTPSEPPPITNGEKPPVHVIGNNNVVSVGQTGGVTAGTYINQVPQPELRLIDQKDEINSNGTHTTTFTVEVASQITPAFLAIDIAAQGIISANIMPPPVGGVSTMMLRNVRRSPTDYHAELTSPRGRYFVSVQTRGQTPIRLSYQF